MPSSKPLILHDDRLLPAEPAIRDIAKRLYSEIKRLPIISPHGHTDPRWFAENKPFDDPAALLIQPDHYLLRMLYSLGIPLERLGIKNCNGDVDNCDPRSVWRLFAEHYHAFRGTPTRQWMDYVFAEVFGISIQLNAATADEYYDFICDCLKKPEFLPRELYDKFNIEVIATTESPLEDLVYHQQIQDSDWSGRIITTFRPDPVIDPDYEGFADNVQRLGEITKEDVGTFSGYLAALFRRREYFQHHGATATDHGHPSALTADLSDGEKIALYKTVLDGKHSAREAEIFRAQMLTEMAAMSLQDGLVMQIHPGSYRNHNDELFSRFGRDKGADIPVQIEYVRALKPLLDRFGNEKDLTIIVFTLDETTYSRELAPLAGHYPALKLGPAWWFHDSPEGMRRYREQVTETAGFYNTVGFNDDTRAFLSIPARHDVARRIDCGYLARLVAEHRLDEDEALDVASDLSYHLARRAYKL